VRPALCVRARRPLRVAICKLHAWLSSLPALSSSHYKYSRCGLVRHRYQVSKRKAKAPPAANQQFLPHLYSSSSSTALLLSPFDSAAHFNCSSHARTAEMRRCSGLSSPVAAVALLLLLICFFHRAAAARPLPAAAVPLQLVRQGACFAHAMQQAHNLFADRSCLPSLSGASCSV
jgi:hypothetical protein